MFKNRGGRIARLVDMAFHPKKEEYHPPLFAREERYEAPLCEEGTQISEIDMLKIRYKHHRGKIVDFAIVQMHQTDDGQWHRVAKIDCCFSTVHKHLYDREGNDLMDHLPICEIPAGEPGQAVVNDRFPEALKLMEDGWEANARRWKR